MADQPQPGDPTPGDEEPAETGPTGLPGGLPGLPGLPIPGLGAGGFDLAALMRMLQSPGPVSWELARQVAEGVALQGQPEPPVDAASRAELEELAHAAQTLVVAESGLAATFRAPVAVVGRMGWVDLHLQALRPVLEALAGTLGEAIRAEAADDADLEPGAEAGADVLAGILPMITPLLLGVQAGSMVGYLATHALGRYDLPLPTADEPSLCFVVRNLDEFEAAWTLPRTDLRFAIALREVVHAAARSVPWVRDRLVRLATEYVSGYRLDVDAFERAFGDVDPTDPASLQQLAARPEALLGAMQSDRQRDVLTRLRVFTSVLEGYADTLLERVATPLIPSFPQVHEALRRHRIERGEAGRFIEGLLGLRLERPDYELGDAFCRGVVERAGLDGLNRLWEREELVPTPPELEAPGLWLARIELPAE